MGSVFATLGLSSTKGCVASASICLATDSSWEMTNLDPQVGQSPFWPIKPWSTSKGVLQLGQNTRSIYEKGENHQGGNAGSLIKFLSATKESPVIKHTGGESRGIVL